MFNLEYQPIVQAKTLNLMGYEALLRHREHRNPLEAIDEARKQGTLALLEAAILEKAARDVVTTNSRLWWNLTWDNFSNPAFLSKALKRLADAGMPAFRVVVELSERSLMDKEEFIAATERWIYNGFGIALDDFGSGRSNQDLLFGEIRPHAVKFDRSLCHGVSEDEDRGRFLVAQIREIWRLGIDVVVEGIETREDLAFFKALSVPVGIQGFVFGYPAMFSVLEEKREEWIRIACG